MKLEIIEEIQWPLSRLKKMRMARAIVRAKKCDHTISSKQTVEYQLDEDQLELKINDAFKMFKLINKMNIIFFLSLIIFFVIKIIFHYHKFIHG